MRINQELSISIVDDDELFCRSLEHYLKERMREPIKIRLFHTGEEFLKNMTADKPDIVVLDFMLNGFYPFAMNGRAVLEKIRQADPYLTVIMVSAQDKIEVALECIKEGAYDYVVKNDNVFLKMQNILKNASRTVLISKKLKRYKWWSSAALIFFSIGVIAELLVLAFF